MRKIDFWWKTELGSMVVEERTFDRSNSSEEEFCYYVDNELENWLDDVVADKVTLAEYGWRDVSFE